MVGCIRTDRVMFLISTLMDWGKNVNTHRHAGENTGSFPAQIIGAGPPTSWLRNVEIMKNKEVLYSIRKNELDKSMCRSNRDAYFLKYLVKMGFILIVVCIFCTTVSASRPACSFNANPVFGSKPLTVHFTIDNIDDPPASWSWSFGDGSVSTLRDPIHTYSVLGVYTVSVNATNSDGREICTRSNYIHIIEGPSPNWDPPPGATLPDASFTANPTSGPAPLTVIFIDTSANTPTSWNWSFGDGNVSSLKDPIHTYSSTGSYTVLLTATNSWGSNTISRRINCTSAPIADFTYSPEKIRPLDKITFDASPSHVTVGSITSYHWDFDDKTTADGIITQHSYQEAGEYNVTLTVVDNYGNSNSTIKKVSVKVPVILIHGFTDSSHCWDDLAWQLYQEDYPFYQFDYSELGESTYGNPEDIAVQLHLKVHEYKSDLKYNGQPYEGKFDIVCHSMGALVSRWYMEKTPYPGAEDIRQWIGVCPVNHGAAIADKDPGLKWATIEAMKTDSPTVTALENSMDSRVIYRVIVGINAKRDVNFGFPLLKNLLKGQTVEMRRSRDGKERFYYSTYLGDGVVALKQSKLSNAGLDYFEGVSHTEAPSNHAVMEKIKDYLKHPERPAIQNLPPEYYGEIISTNTYKKQIIKTTTKNVFLAIGQEIMRIWMAWPGSDLNLTLVSPRRQVISGSQNPSVEYVKEGNSICYILKNPEPGEWTAVIDPIDIPAEGEPITFMVTSSDSSMMGLNVTGITPPTALNSGSVGIIDLKGSGFSPNVSVKLTRPGSQAIPASDITVVSQSMITCNFDLTNKDTGPWDVVVTKSDGQSATLPNGFMIMAQPGSILTISSYPTGADILIDDIQRGTTPTSVKEILPGTHSVAITKPGYFGYYSMVSITAGQPSAVDVTLQPLPTGTMDSKATVTVTAPLPYQPKDGVVFISSVPTGATIYIDDQPKGVTDTSLHLNAGTYILKLTKEKYKDNVSVLSIGAGDTIHLNKTLETPGFECVLAVGALLGAGLFVMKRRK